MTRIFTQDNNFWEDYSSSQLYSIGRIVGWVNETVVVSDKVMGLTFENEEVDEVHEYKHKH